MLTVRTEVKASSIPNAGLGLFAAEFIPAGKRICTFVEGFDRAYTEGEIVNLPKEAQLYLYSYLWVSSLTGLYCVSMDNARYINHANPANSGFQASGSLSTRIEQDNFALRDIQIGEEITANYLEFYQDSHIWDRICENTGRTYDEFDYFLEGEK